MVLGRRDGHRVAVDHVRREVHEARTAGGFEALQDVLDAMEIHRPEEVVPFRPRHDRAQHLGRQIVDHVVGADVEPADGVAIRDVDVLESDARFAMPRGLCDVGDDDLLAHGGEIAREHVTNETTTPEENVSHACLLPMQRLARWNISYARPEPCPDRSAPRPRSATTPPARRTRTRQRPGRRHRRG